MKEWFQGLAPRERLIVGGGGGVAALVFLYVLLIEPMAQAFVEREQRIERLEGDLAWMVEVANEVEALRGAGRTGAAPDDERPAYLAVDGAVRSARLGRPERLEPNGEDQARVQFAEVEFDRLMGALADLEAESAIVVTRARIDRVAAGRVRAELTLERRGP